ncbi:hypothetical protein LIP_2990 [Limnochorda pilosa]|uniref:PorV/PorQ family protein n=1 Tax=Limnochorda pilosa TaxID=1555112 RepID=A0A0K2SPR8_LIMPI|nr:hypothetical protein LIP_2990 [Limnochorda pilosa]
MGILVLSALLPLPPVHANPVTARALGMGNAFTAVAEGFHALYWNPAGLAVNGYELSAGLGGLALPRIGEVIDTFEAGNPQALTASLETFAGIRLGQAAIGAALEAETGQGDPDLQVLDWYGIGVGFPLTPPEGWSFLSVGMTLRHLAQRTARSVASSIELSPARQAERLDLGVLAEPQQGLRVGLTLRDVWTSDVAPDALEPSESRVGIAYQPQGWSAGLRADLSTEGTLSYGVEWPVDARELLKLRLGQQLVPGMEVMTTAGAGLHLGPLRLDVAAGLTRLDPEATRVRADLSVQF